MENLLNRISSSRRHRHVLGKVNMPWDKAKEREKSMFIIMLTHNMLKERYDPKNKKTGISILLHLDISIPFFHSRGLQNLLAFHPLDTHQIHMKRKHKTSVIIIRKRNWNPYPFKQTNKLTCQIGRTASLSISL